MRLFVALDLNDAVRQALSTLVADLKKTAPSLRWVQPDNLHLTLKFIGNVSETKNTPIQEALGVVRTREPVEMHFEGLGFFPNPRSPRVFWVGVRGNEALAQVAREVESCLEPLGIAREQRAYVPHLTLARFRVGPSRKPDLRDLRGLQEKIQSLPATDFGEVRCEQFFLYESRLSPAGARYTKLRSFRFVAN